MTSTKTKVQKPGKPPSQGLASTWTQAFPPKPSFTEASLPDLTSQVYIVTGSNVGVGYEVARILYSKNAKVYMAARSKPKAERAIKTIQEAHPSSEGELVFLHLDLSDLRIVRQAAQTFLEKETKLHVLFNNAGLQAITDDKGEQRTAQGFEVHLGVNVLGPFLFTQLLTPVLVATASAEKRPNTVRVVWVSSSGTEIGGEPSKGMSPEYVDYWPQLSPLDRYGVSKAGNWLHGVELAKRLKSQGVISIPLNPGNLSSDLYRDWGCLLKTVLSTLMLHPVVYGAYTELWAGLSEEVTIERSGEWGKTLNLKKKEIHPGLLKRKNI
ncbi:NAD(P)-binding protein [Cryphonectria parasitica EP155]|uniref:NAD(P)-binding protein n=1 Tax=Cryphonectria parasitica (strain ATCC 38755 / EP155) TaxID=660469 RepID=A0A9P4XYF2_CRYP1|nr:NAD(P)-binding protein [Cryphonectria parasitica EP155]KAF3763077.1 NAD(P)-binding protein [Cryphonectria parasitica EP155]